MDHQKSQQDHTNQKYVQYHRDEVFSVAGFGAMRGVISTTRLSHVENTRK